MPGKVSSGNTMWGEQRGVQGCPGPAESGGGMQMGSWEQGLQGQLDLGTGRRGDG